MRNIETNIQEEMEYLEQFWDLSNNPKDLMVLMKGSLTRLYARGYLEGISRSQKSDIIQVLRRQIDKIHPSHEISQDDEMEVVEQVQALSQVIEILEKS